MNVPQWVLVVLGLALVWVLWERQPKWAALLVILLVLAYLMRRW